MEFLYDEVYNGRNKVVVLSHKDQRLEWMIERYRNFRPTEFVFGDVNRIMARLDDAQQDALWALYETAHTAIQTIANHERLTSKLQLTLKKIEEIVSYDDVVAHVKRENTLWVPKVTEQILPTNASVEGFSQQVNPPIQTPANHLTYSQEDCEHLNIFIIYLKFYLPILSQYCILTDSEVNEFFQRFKTIQLLNRLDLINKPGYTRLYRFIEHFWNGDNSEFDPGILLKGLSAESAIDWVLSETIFKKLIPAEVSHRYHNIPDENRPNVIKSLFHNIRSYAEYLNRGDKDTHFRTKDGSKHVGSEEDTSSKLESYKISSEFSELVIVTHLVFLEKRENILRHLDPTLPVELVDQVGYSEAHHRTYHPIRTALMKWLLAKAISPKIIDYIYTSKKAYSNCFQITYALLMHWGFTDLAKLIDGRYEADKPRFMLFNLTAVTADQVKQLNQFYPFTIRSNRQKGESLRNSNYAIIACAELEEEMKGVSLTGYNHPETWDCTISIQHRLAELLIHMNLNGHI